MSANEIAEKTGTTGNIIRYKGKDYYNAKPVKNPLKKKKIIELARRSGCDVDGDIVYCNGTAYFVNIYDGVVGKMLGQPFKSVPWNKKRKINGGSIAMAWLSQKKDFRRRFFL